MKQRGTTKHARRRRRVLGDHVGTAVPQQQSPEATRATIDWLNDTRAVVEDAEREMGVDPLAGDVGAK